MQVDRTELNKMIDDYIIAVGVTECKTGESGLKEVDSRYVDPDFDNVEGISLCN